jgi:stage V sporulation protein K
MVFQGPPGTGKTTVAQLIGQILVEIGQGQKYVAVDHIGQLIGPFTNTEAKHIHEFLHDNTNNVMFLDEAHQLGDDPERASLRYVHQYLCCNQST